MHCRTCYDEIKASENHHTIDELIGWKTISEILHEIAGIDTKIESTSEFQHICVGCVNKIKNCFEFVQKAQKVNVQLLQQYKQKVERSYLEELPIDFPSPINEINNEIKFDIDEYQLQKTSEDNDDNVEANVKVEDYFPDPIVQLEEESIEEERLSTSTRATPSPIEDNESDSDYEDDEISLKTPPKRKRGRPRKHAKQLRTDGINTCEICGKSFKWSKDLVRHARTHTMKPELKCEHCDRLFFRKDKLNDHKKIHLKHQSDSSARYRATKRTEWNFAKCLYGKPVLKLVLCKLCGSEFSKISELSQHMPLHKDPLTFSLQADNIKTKDFSKQLEWQGEYEIKMNICNEISKAYYAPYYSIVNEYGYELSLSDSDDSGDDCDDNGDSSWNKYNCMICKETFRRQYQIFAHALEKHLNVKLPFKCNVCKVTFVSSEMLQNHERRQCKNKARKFQCSDCPGKFMWSENFENHQCSKDQSKPIVKIVESVKAPSVRSKKSRENCKKMMASRRTTKKLQCSLCEKTFIWPKDLTRHMRMHLPDREKFQCPICERRFNRKDNMQAHLKVHGEETTTDTKKKDANNGKQSRVQAVDENLTRPHGCKVIECTICQSKQMRLSDLKEHLNKHQLDNSYVDRWTSIEKIAETIYPELGKSLTKNELTKRITADLAAKQYERFYSVTNEMGYELNLSSSETDTDSSDTDIDTAANDDYNDDNCVRKKKKSCKSTADIYTCELCKEKFERKFKLFKHQTEKHAWDELQYTCIHCNGKFVCRRLLDWHYNRQCKNTLKRFLCKKCPLRFMWKNNLEAHVRTSHTERSVEKLKTTLGNESNLCCTKCNRQFTMQKDLTRHLLMQTCSSENAELLKCLYCSRKFYRQEYLYAHIERHGISSSNYATAECIIRATNKPNGSKQIYCRICNIVFSSIETLREHLLKESSSTLTQHFTFESPLNYGISNSLGFEMHIDDSETEDEQQPTSNNTISRPPYQCAICNLFAKRKYEMAQHQLSMHKYEQLPFQCDRCIFRTVSQDILAQHMRSQCYNVDKKYQCDLCQFKFMWPEHLEIHQRLCHTETKPLAQQLVNNATVQTMKGEQPIFQCDQCPCKYNRKDRLNAHIKRIHLSKLSSDDKNSINANAKRKAKSQDNSNASGEGGDIEGAVDVAKKAVLERKFLCAFCGRGLTSSSNLIIHMRRHTGEKPYKCDFCQMAFPRSSDLAAHRRKHTGERPFPCTICDKAFSRSYKLMLHMRTHTGERPHKCTYCEKSFTQSNDLTLHIRRHTGERPYLCGCGERFIQGTALKNHRMMRGHFEETEDSLPV